MDRIILTGVTGFVGARLAQVLNSNHGVELIGVARKAVSCVNFPGECYAVGDINGQTNWSEVLNHIDVVIHTAARAHITKDEVSEPLTAYRKVNVDGTLNFARQAASAGAQRFIFISSIGVNGSTNNRPFTEDDQPNPVEPYAQSKLEAEQGLWQIQQETGMEIVIIRPPLVYGPNAPGNFGSLVKWVKKGIPLPLGAVHNQRSLVALDNLVDLVITCIDHPAAANQVFLAGDGEDLSTTELLRGVARTMGRSSRLIPVPAWMLMLGATIVGKKAVAQRLLGSLQVDITKAREILGWEPPISVDEGLRRAMSSDKD